MKTRIHLFGRSRESFFDQKEYGYFEAVDLLGPCKRISKEYGTIMQGWSSSTGWSDVDLKQVKERYDVWQNERGDMILAKPLPLDGHPPINSRFW